MNAPFWQTLQYADSSAERALTNCAERGDTIAPLYVPLVTILVRVLSTFPSRLSQTSSAVALSGGVMGEGRFEVGSADPACAPDSGRKSEPAGGC